MCAVMLIKITFIEVTSEKKIIRCFQIKYLNFNQYMFFFFFSIIYKHTKHDFGEKISIC